MKTSLRVGVRVPQGKQPVEPMSRSPLPVRKAQADRRRFFRHLLECEIEKILGGAVASVGSGRWGIRIFGIPGERGGERVPPNAESLEIYERPTKMPGKFWTGETSLSIFVGRSYAPGETTHTSRL